MDWEFPNSQDTAVFTLRRIIDGSSQILMVTHDTDGSWQFLDGKAANTEDFAVIGLGEIVKLDPSLEKLANLALGQKALRSSIDAEWEITDIS